MKSYHVHLYAVAGKSEVNVQAENDVDARSKALEMANKGECGPLMPSDCRLTAERIHMHTMDQIEEIRNAVLDRVRKLRQPFLGQYEGAVTEWLIRNVLECAEQTDPGDIERA